LHGLDENDNVLNILGALFAAFNMFGGYTQKYINVSFSNSFVVDGFKEKADAHATLISIASSTRATKPMLDSPTTLEVNRAALGVHIAGVQITEVRRI
jgi:hypothetical protein